MTKKSFLKKPTDSCKIKECQLICWEGGETTTNQGPKLGRFLVVYICVLLQKSPRHCMLLCLCVILSVCLLCKGQRIAVPKTPLILYHHIQSACLFGKGLGVERIWTLQICVCHLPNISVHINLHFVIIFLVILFSCATGTLPVIPIAKVTLFQHIASTEIHTYNSHVNFVSL